MSVEILPVTWSEGASPEAMMDAFGEAALTVAVLDALLEEPVLRKKAVAALQSGAEPDQPPTR